MPVEMSEGIQTGLGTMENLTYITIMAGIGASILGHISKFGIGTTTFAKFGIGDGSSKKNLG